MTDKNRECTLLALFAGVDEAARACRSLVVDGVASEELSVLSDIPVPEEALAVAEPRLSLQWFTLAGGFVGIAAGIGLTVGTSLAYPIRTGHMPILPALPYAIIAYELMMLVAILTTVAGFVIAILRGRRPAPLYDEGVEHGEIGILVYCADDGAVQKARGALAESDALRIRQSPGRHL